MCNFLPKMTVSNPLNSYANERNICKRQLICNTVALLHDF